MKVCHISHHIIIRKSDAFLQYPIYIFYFISLADLQLKVKDSLYMTWKHSLSHDWIPVERAKTFPLREFYVGLRWVRVVKRAIQNFQQELTSIYDIFELLDNNEARATNLLITGTHKYMLETKHTTQYRKPLATLILPLKFAITNMIDMIVMISPLFVFC